MSVVEILSGGGEMGALARQVDWGQTPVGPADRWPQSLRTALSILLESKFPMLLCWGPDFVQFYNDPFRPILGQNKHPALGKSTRETFVEAWHIIGPLFEQVMQGTAVGFEDMLVPLDRNGFLEECYFVYSYSPIRDESGGVGGVLVTCTETTGRVLAERRLNTLRELASQAAQPQTVDAAWAGAARVLATSRADLPFSFIYELDEDGGAARIVEPSSAEWVPPLIAPADTGTWPLFDAAAAGSEQVVDDVRRRFGDQAGPIWPEPVARAVVLPITHPGRSGPYGFLVAGLSPRLALDAKYRDFLSLVADQIATAIANARLRRESAAQHKAAESANRAKDEFLAMLGHELRNPLAPILTALQLMTLRGDVGAEKERAVIERQVRHVVRLVDDLLDVSRIARGKIELKREHVELATIVAKAVEVTSPLIEQKHHTLEVEVPQEGLAVEGDPTRLQQILFNLLNNAAKYTEPRGRIAITASRTGEAIELRVRDSGIGIDPAMLPNIFELFVQERQALDRSQGGLGLGLAIVRNLVELHGGRVSASSGGRGQGSEFIVTLPASSVGVSAPPPSPAMQPSTSAGARRVLVVDDNEDAANFLAEALRVAGFETRTAADGPAALRTADEFAPHVALLDLGLPVMDGYELADHLQRAASAPILIAVSGYGSKGDQERSEASGFATHLVKPVDIDEVITRLRALRV